jgi:hypothetical protein
MPISLNDWITTKTHSMITNMWINNIELHPTYIRKAIAPNQTAELELLTSNIEVEKLVGSFTGISQFSNALKDIPLVESNILAKLQPPVFNSLYAEYEELSHVSPQQMDLRGPFNYVMNKFFYIGEQSAAISTETADLSMYRSPDVLNTNELLANPALLSPQNEMEKSAQTEKRALSPPLISIKQLRAKIKRDAQLAIGELRYVKKELENSLLAASDAATGMNRRETLAAGAIPVRGLRNSSMQGQLKVAILDRNWDIEDEIQAQVIQHPFIDTGRVIMTVSIPLPLVGRRAHVLFSSEKTDFLLDSAILRESSEDNTSNLEVDVDLTDFGIKKQEGRLPIEKFLILIAPEK